MSRWEADRHIATETSRTTGEIMLSASDVVAWLRDRAHSPCAAAHTLEQTADDLASGWLALTRDLLDGSGS